MKCPYCGKESRTQVCEKCKAMIPEEKPTEKEEHVASLRKRKEMKNNGT